MPCGVFCGVNNHGQTIPFAGCLLRDETTTTFTSLFNAFIAAGGQKPGAILTDQDHAMNRALSEILPDTKHAFCLWHITRKFPTWFNSSLKGNLQAFLKAFLHCMLLGR